MEYVRRRFLISGKVQGVGFRHFTRQAARSLGLRGWVRNCRDGSVEAVAEGDPGSLDQFLEELQKGPRPAKVEGVKTEQVEPGEPELGPFDVKPTV